MGPLGHFLSARKFGSTVRRAEIRKSTFKGAAPPSDGHGDLVMAVGTRFGHDPQAFPRNAVIAPFVPLARTVSYMSQSHE